MQIFPARVRLLHILSFLSLFVIVSGVSAQKFISAPVQTVTGIPQVIATGDFNRDGLADVVYQDGFANGSLHVMAGLGDGTFKEVQQIALPANVGGSITVADLNGDGFPDLILGYDGFHSNFTGPEMTALLNRGDGTFGQPIFSAFPIYAGPETVVDHLAVADFDGDGHNDFIFTASAGAILMRGDGAGHFTPQVVSATPVGVHNDVYVADLNEDGKPDIAFNGIFSVHFALNIGGGNFGPVQSVASILSNPPEGFAVADLNRDGHQDILYGYNGILFIAYGKGDGTFAAPVHSGASLTTARYSVIAIQDVNGDGRPDIITSNSSGPVVHLQDASGQFPGFYASGPAVGDTGLLAPVFADFDGDAVGDIISGATGALVFSKGSTNGIFNGALATAAGASLDVQPADFNRDGFLDLAITNGGGSYYGSVYTYLGDGTGRFTESGYAPNPYPTFAGQSSIADFNGDGIPDVFNAGYALNGDGKGSFLPAQLIAAPPTVNRPFGFTAIADFNEDGYPDPITATVSAGGGSIPTIAVGLSTGPNAWKTIQISLPDLSGPLVVADFNKDGHKDIATASASNIYIIQGDGKGNFTLTQTLPIGYTAQSYAGIQYGQNDMEGADIDGDGNIDLLVPIADKNVIQIFYGRGDGTFGPAVSLPTAQDVRYITAYDMDGDGTQDLVLGGHALVRILHGTGHRTFEANPSSFAANPYPQKIRVADVNRDGNPDLLVPNGGYSAIVEPGYGFTVLLNAATAVSPDLIYASSICNPEPSVIGQPFSCTATFRPAANTASPSGTVTFLLDGVLAGNVTLNAQRATYQFPNSISPGSHIIEADFGGDAIFRAVKTTTTHFIVYASAVITLSGPTHVAFGQTVPFQVAVSGSLGSPTGTISFADGASQTAQTMLAGGAASFSATNLTAGTHTFQASYGGDGTYAPGLSNTLIVIVDPQPTTITLQATPLTAPFGSTISLQATVSAHAGPVTGTVNFLDGPTMIGTASVGTNGLAQLQLGTFAVGAHTLTAQFIASTSFATSTSPTVQVVITGILTTATLTSTPNPSYPGQSVTFTATVSSASPPQAFPGTVRFLDGTSILADVPFTTAGLATFSTTTLTIGTHPIVASYLGNGLLVPSQSNVIQQVVLDSGFSLAVIPSKITLQTQHHTTFSLSVTPLGLFKGTVTLGCGTLPEHATCHIDQPTIRLTAAGGPQDVTVHFDTSDVLNYAGAGDAPRLHDHPESLMAAIFFPSLAVCGVLLSRTRRLRHLRLLVAAFSFLAAASLATGCSGKYPASVAPGVYILHFTGSSSTATSQTGLLELTVMP